MATKSDVEALKRDWVADPCWDLEETEGFEEHREELAAFCQEMKAHWEREQRERLEAKAAAMGIPDNLELAAYLMRLENRVTWLEQELDGLSR